MSRIADALMANMPTFATPQAAQVAPTDVVGPIMQKYASELAQWQAGENSKNSTMGALFGLGGSALTAGLMPGGFLSGMFGPASYAGAPIMSLGANLAKFGR